jgi:hypothetical protein
MSHHQDPSLRARTSLLVRIALAGAAYLPAVSALGADPSAADLYPRLDAYYACGYDFAAKSADKSIDGAQRACRGRLESYLEIVSFMAQMTNPREMQRARPDDPVVVKKVAETRMEVQAEFARRVREQLARK